MAGGKSRSLTLLAFGHRISEGQGRARRVRVCSSNGVPGPPTLNRIQIEDFACSVWRAGVTGRSRFSQVEVVPGKQSVLVAHVPLILSGRPRAQMKGLSPRRPIARNSGVLIPGPLRFRRRRPNSQARSQGGKAQLELLLPGETANPLQPALGLCQLRRFRSVPATQLLDCIRKVIANGAPG